MQPQDNKSDFESWISIFIGNSQWISKACTKWVSGTVPWCLCSSEEAFGITELFKQAAQVTNCTQESREQDLALTTPPGPMHCVFVCVFFINVGSYSVSFWLRKIKTLCVCVLWIKEQLNFSARRKISPESITPPSFQWFVKAHCLPLEMVGLAIVILRD